MKASYDIFGIVDHRENSGHICLFSEQLGPKNTDHTVSQLQTYIQGVKINHPWLQRVMIFLDNAASTKNAICLPGNGGYEQWHHQLPTHLLPGCRACKVRT